jgi:hypothetical protein
MPPVTSPVISLVSANTPTIASLITSAPDARADGGVRHIRLAEDSIRIERQVGGVKMRVAVPLDGYRGVVLKSETTRDRRFCRIALEHSDPELTVELYQAHESPDALAIWLDWADYFAKPALCEATPHASLLGDLGMPQAHRRGAPLVRRRPRFLKRRHSNRMYKA